MAKSRANRTRFDAYKNFNFRIVMSRLKASLDRGFLRRLRFFSAETDSK